MNLMIMHEITYLNATKCYTNMLKNIYIILETRWSHSVGATFTCDYIETSNLMATPDITLAHAKVIKLLTLTTI